MMTRAHQRCGWRCVWGPCWQARPTQRSGARGRKPTAPLASPWPGQTARAPEWPRPGQRGCPGSA
eukprot:15480188-Alexandrium_andersonii.AAC.1